MIAGTYLFQAVAIDDDGATTRDTIQVIISAANVPPTANAGTDQSLSAGTTSSTLTGSGSDVDGTITYAWTQFTGPNTSTILSPSSPSTTISGLAAGTYTYELAVTDDDAAVTRDTVSVTITATNAPPTVYLGGNTSTMYNMNQVLLVSDAYDSDGTIQSYHWTQISGDTAYIGNPTSASTYISELTPGVRVFRCTVTDNAAGVGYAEITLTIDYNIRFGVKIRPGAIISTQ